MHPNDRDPAFGIVLGFAISAPITVAIIAAIVAWGEPVLRNLAWVALVIAALASEAPT